MNQLAANLVDRVIPEVPVRHWVLSFPFRLRFLLARHPDLRNEVLGIFHKEVQIWLREATGEPTGKGGAVSVWQMAGSTLNLNPHVHSIVLDGQYIRDDTTGDLVFRRARRPPARRLQELVEWVRLRVERLLVARGFDEDTQCDEEDGLLPLQVASVEGRGVRRRRGNASSGLAEKDGVAWSGWFDLHAGSSIEGEDRERIERLARYIARPPFSVKHLSRRADGHVVLTLHHAWRDGTTCVEFDPMTPWVVWRRSSHIRGST